MQSAVKKGWCNIVRDEHNVAGRSGKLRLFCLIIKFNIDLKYF